jgi:hypothetical protein
MHEDMHEGAGENGKPDQQSEHVSAMFGKQQNAADQQKPDQNHARARPQQASAGLVATRVSMLRMIV